MTSAGNTRWLTVSLTEGLVAVPHAPVTTHRKSDPLSLWTVENSYSAKIALGIVLQTAPLLTLFSHLYVRLVP
jgi:hypothetical protein